jgi:hypothetical protein
MLADGGVDENEFTTSLDTSSLTPEQIRRAEEIARSIQSDMKHGNARSSANPPQAPPGQYGGGQQYNVSAGNDLKAMLNIGSAEEAMEMRRQMKLREAQQTSQPGFVQQQGMQQMGGMQAQRAPAPSLTPQEQLANEHKCMDWLRSQLERFVGLVVTHGDPNPGQAAKLMRSLGAQLTQLLPYPPQEIKNRIVADFLAVGWDVRTRKPVPASKPPSGLRICELVYSTGCFMANRLGQQQPADPSSRLAQMQSQRQFQTQRSSATQQRSQYNNGQQRGYKGGKGGKGKGQRNGKGKGGKGGYKGGYRGQQQSQGYSSRPNQNSSRSSQNQPSSNGFTVVGGNRNSNNTNRPRQQQQQQQQHTGNTSGMNAKERRAAARRAQGQ